MSIAISQSCAQNLQIISPPLASEDEARRYFDRCNIAWYGPDGERRYGVEINFADEEYGSEPWYWKLFTGPEEHRLKIGDNDPDWNKDIAAAVRRTVAFVDAELQVPLGERGAAMGAATPQSAASASSSSLGGNCKRESTRPAPVAAQAQQAAVAAAAAAVVDESERKKPKRERAEVIDLEASPLKATAPLAPVPASSPAAGSHSVNVATAAAAAATPAPNAAAHTTHAPIALGTGAATPSASSAEAALAAPKPPRPAAPVYTAPNPTLVLKWTDRETLAWLAERFALTADGPAYRVLRRLALTGPLLLLRPACFLRRHLLEALKEEISSELAIVLASLDVMVELLVEEAREGPLEARARGELDRLLARRTREAAAGTRARAGESTSASAGGEEGVPGGM
eukprot:tig00020675_g12629.t1